MSDALREIGFLKALKYTFGQVQICLLKNELLLAPLRTFALRLFGSRINNNCIVHACTFFNVYRGGFGNLNLGHHCFIGNECLLDLAACITLESHVTLAERVTILTHTNVGFASHPLQTKIGPSVGAVIIRSGAFIGTNATILAGVTIGEQAIVGAGALVREDVPPRTMVVGVPARAVA